MSDQAAPRAEIDFDPARLRAWLQGILPGLAGEMQVERIGGGQSNPTYFITIGDRRLVLRKRPVGNLPKPAHDVAREYLFISSLTGSGVPVPGPIAVEEDVSVIGTAFYVMERVDGRIFHDATMLDVPPAERRAYYREFAHNLAALHAIDWKATPLAALVRPGRYLVRQVDRWARAWGALETSDPEVMQVADWLRAHMPDDDVLGLVHGDFKFTNVIFDPTEARMAAVLDWELAAIGDPLTDVAHIWSALWETTKGEYGGLMDADLAAQGLPTGEEFFEDYHAASGSARRVTPFYLVLAHFRNAGIFHGIGERAAAGSANAANAAETGLMDRVYLHRARDIIERIPLP